MKKKNKVSLKEKINARLNPSEDELKNITFRVPEKLLEKFKKESKPNSMNSVVIELIKDYLGLKD